jgi:hypothetical protein
MPTENKSKQRIAQFLTNWIFKWVLFVGAFLLATARNTDIQNSFKSPSAWYGPTGINGFVVAFWILALGWASLTAFNYRFDHQNSQERAAEDAKRANELLKASNELISHIESVKQDSLAISATLSEAHARLKAIEHAHRTLPSDEFRTEYALKSGYFYQTIGTAMPRGLKSEYGDGARTIRELLAVMLSLRNVYEGKRSARYAANIMLFCKAGDGHPRVSAQLMEKVRRTAPNPDVKDGELLGVLDLCRELSTSTDAPTEIDDKVADIAFAIPHTSRIVEEGSEWVLPGAVETYLQSAAGEQEAAIISGYPDTSSLAYLTRLYRINPEYLYRLNRYFRSESGLLVRSFVTLPLRHPNFGTFGVLNIHSTLEWTNPQENDRQINYALVSMPLVNEVAEACVLWALQTGRPMEAYEFRGLKGMVARKLPGGETS